MRTGAGDPEETNKEAPANHVSDPRLMQLRRPRPLQLKPTGRQFLFEL